MREKVQDAVRAGWYLIQTQCGSKREVLKEAVTLKP